MKRNLCAVFITILVLALCAPAASASELGDIAGTWRLIGVETGGMRLVPFALGLEMTIVLTEDYTATVLTDGQAADKPGTWAISDGRILLSADGADRMMVTPVDGNLVIEQDEMKLIFGKENVSSAPADAAHADVFTHPAGIYTLTIPDGWIAIDGALAEGLLAMGLDVVENRNFGYVDMSGEDRPDGAVIMLFEIERIDGLFRNCINIGVLDLGQDFSTDAILSHGDGFVGLMQSSYEGYVPTAPIAKKSFGKLETVVLSGEFTRDGQKHAVRQAIFTDKGILYTITLFAHADQIAKYEPVWAEVINSMPYAKENKADATAVLDRGMELIEAQDYAGALAHFDAAIAESGDAAGFHFYRGWALSELYRSEEAERAFAKAVELEPDNARYLDEYGASLIHTGKYQDAYEAIDKAVQLEPLNGEYIGDRGFVLYLLNRPGEALPELERAIELAPDYENAYYFAAIIQYGLGAFEEAARYCEAFLERVPNADEMWLMLGDARMELGGYAEALAAYDKAIANGYFTAEDIANYADAKEKAGETGTADKTGEAESSEGLAYRNEAYGLSFTLPEGWSRIPNDYQEIFSGPDGSDSLLLIGLTGQRVDAGFAVIFQARVADKLMRESALFSQVTFTELTPILFASAMDEDGRLYAMYMCRFAGEGFADGYKLLYAQLFFTDENGMLGEMSMITPAAEGDSALPLFDAIVKENVPQDVLTELNEKIGEQMFAQD